MWSSLNSLNCWNTLSFGLLFCKMEIIIVIPSCRVAAKVGTDICKMLNIMSNTQVIKTYWFYYYITSPGLFICVQWDLANIPLPFLCLLLIYEIYTVTWFLFSKERWKGYKMFYKCNKLHLVYHVCVYFLTSVPSVIISEQALFFDRKPLTFGERYPETSFNSYLQIL